MGLRLSLCVLRTMGTNMTLHKYDSSLVGGVLLVLAHFPSHGIPAQTVTSALTVSA